MFELAYTRFTIGGGLYGAIGHQIGVALGSRGGFAHGPTMMLGYAFSRARA